jgi:hypothetical protein
LAVDDVNAIILRSEATKEGSLDFCAPGYNRVMTLDELETEAKKLDPASRAALISRLSASLAALQNAPGNSAPGAPAPPTEEQKEREWLQEALRRSRELRERQIQTEPPDRRPTPAATAAAEPRPAPRPAATADAKPTSTKTSIRPRKPKPRRPARPVAKKRAAARPKPRPRPKAAAKKSSKARTAKPKRR